eukprot:427651_1
MGSFFPKEHENKSTKHVTSVIDIVKTIDDNGAIREEHDPIPKQISIIGKLHDKKIVHRYIQLLSQQYNLLFPVEIAQICFLFYNDQQGFYWTIDLERDQKHNLNLQTYNQSFEVLLFNTDIRGTITCNFSIEKRKAHLKISIGKPRTDNNEYQRLLGHATKIYYSIICNELKYDNKNVNEWYASDKNIIKNCDIKEIEKLSSLKFILSFRILPSLLMRQKIQSLNVYPRTKKSFVWQWNKTLMTKLKDENDNKTYFSANFFNEACYCLWVKNNNKLKDKNEQKEKNVFDGNKIQLMFQLCVLSNPYQYNTKLFGGVIKLFDANGIVSECELVKIHREVIIELDKNVIIKLVEFTFKFYDSLI